MVVKRITKAEVNSETTVEKIMASVLDITEVALDSISNPEGKTEVAVVCSFGQFIMKEPTARTLLSTKAWSSNCDDEFKSNEYFSLYLIYKANKNPEQFTSFEIFIDSLNIADMNIILKLLVFFRDKLPQPAGAE